MYIYFSKNHNFTYIQQHIFKARDYENNKTNSLKYNMRRIKEPKKDTKISFIYNSRIEAIMSVKVGTRTHKTPKKC